MITNAERLIGVKDDLCAVVRSADTILTPKGIHIRVQEGLRTPERQAQYVANGTSWTMNSRHLTGHAVDLVTLVDLDHDGKIEIEELYSWQLAFQVASAMKIAAGNLNIALVWGGCWDRTLAEIRDPESAMADYVARRKKRGLRANVDGPHYELAKSKYP